MGADDERDDNNGTFFIEEGQLGECAWEVEFYEPRLFLHAGLPRGLQSFGAPARHCHTRPHDHTREAP